MITPEREAFIRSGIEAWNSGGIDAFEPWLSPAIEWTAPDEIPGAGTFHGREATMAFLREFEAGGGGVRLELELAEIIDLGGDDALLVMDSRVTADSTGVELPPYQWFMLARWEDGLLSRNRVFMNREAAFAAAGLPASSAG